MPVADTELIFGLNPNDTLHKQSIKLLKMKKLVFPDTALLEFQLVLRGRGYNPTDVKMAILAILQILRNHNIPEVQTINTKLFALQSELEDSYLLSYFDSLIAASTLKLDSHIISDDEAFDRIPELKRTPIKKS